MLQKMHNAFLIDIKKEQTNAKAGKERKFAFICW